VSVSTVQRESPSTSGFHSAVETAFRSSRFRYVRLVLTQKTAISGLERQDVRRGYGPQSRPLSITNLIRQILAIWREKHSDAPK
jgi:hypothetical protein